MPIGMRSGAGAGRSVSMRGQYASARRSSGETGGITVDGPKFGQYIARLSIEPCIFATATT